MDVLDFWSFVDHGGVVSSSNDDDDSSSHQQQQQHDGPTTTNIDNIINNKDKSNAEILICGAWKILNNIVFYAPALQQPVLTLACAALCLSAEEMILTKTATTTMIGKNANNQHTNSNILPLNWWKALGILDLDLEKTKECLMDASHSLQDFMGR
eukprot:12764815-Ditylum_brightwellii.AAC.1